MTPEEKAKFNDMLKQMGVEQTYDELEAVRKRAVRTLNEWCTQSPEQCKELPQEVKDLKMVGRYTLFGLITGVAPVGEAMMGIDMAVEAAFNFGRAESKRCGLQ